MHTILVEKMYDIFLGKIFSGQTVHELFMVTAEMSKAYWWMKCPVDESTPHAKLAFFQGYIQT